MFFNQNEDKVKVVLSSMENSTFQWVKVQKLCHNISLEPNDEKEYDLQTHFN